MKTVYLAGPILNCTHGEANDWRHTVASQLDAAGIRGVSPLRCEPLIGERYAAEYNDPKFGTARAIGSKNLYDVRACDMGIYYLPKNPYHTLDWHQSYGTMQEMAWSFILGKPTILCSDDPEILAHPVLNFNAGWVVPELDDAVDICIGLLGGYTPGGKNV